MEKTKTFEELNNERQLKRFMGSPYGTMYYPSEEPRGEETMIRHFDSDLPPDLIPEYIELYGLVKEWIDSKPNVNDIVFMKELTGAGEDFIIRSFYSYDIATRHYNEKKSIKTPELYKQMQKVVLDELEESLKNNIVLRRIIENSLLKPNGRVHYDNRLQIIIIAEPKITRQDLEEWREFKRCF